MIRTLKDRVRSRFDVRMSEVGGQASKDSWQYIVLGFAVVTGSRRHAEDGLEKIASFVDAAGLARVIGDRREVLAFTDDDAMPASSGLEGWVPEEWADQAPEDSTAGPREQALDESLDETVDLDDEELP